MDPQATISLIIRAERERTSSSVDLTAGIRLLPMSRSVSSFKQCIRRREEFIRKTSLIDDETKAEALRCLKQDYRWYSYLRGQPAVVIKKNHDVMTKLSNIAADRRYTRDRRTRMLGVLYLVLQHEATAPVEEAKNAPSECCTIS